MFISWWCCRSCLYSSGVATWLLDFAPGACLPEVAGLFTTVSSAKLSDTQSDKCQPGHSGFLIDNNNIAIIVRFHFHKIYSNSIKTIKIMARYTVFNVNAVVKLKRHGHNYMPTFQNKTKIMTRTVVFSLHINSHAVDYSRVRRLGILKMPHFQTAITRQFYGDNVFF